MKYRFKFFVFLIFLMIFTGNVSAQTVNVNTNRSGTIDANSYYVTNTGTLSVTGVQSTETFEAFKIIDIYYNQNNDTFYYELTSLAQSAFLALFNDPLSEEYSLITSGQFNIILDNDIKNGLLESGNIANGSTLTDTNFDIEISGMANYIVATNANGQALTTSGTTASATLEAGMYLILPTNTNRVYAVMVGNIQFIENNSEWLLHTDTIVAKVSDVGIYAFDSETQLPSASYNKGEDIYIRANVTLPVYPTNATNKYVGINLTVDNSLGSRGFVIHSGSMNIYPNIDSETVIYENNEPVGYSYDLVHLIDSDNFSYTTVGRARAVVGNIFLLELDYDYLESNILIIDATTYLNDNAELGNSGNNVSLSLIYANDPYGSGTTTSATSAITIYTYGLTVTCENDNGDGLPNAEYEIYSDSELNNYVGTIVTDENGEATLEGLSSGTYYLVQSHAARGYMVDDDVIEVTIDTTTDYTSVDLVNVKAGILPVTGGIGNYIFICTGLLIIIGAMIYLYCISKKREKREQK